MSTSNANGTKRRQRKATWTSSDAGWQASAGREPFYVTAARRAARAYLTPNPERIAERMGIRVLCLPMRHLYGLAVSLGAHRPIGVSAFLNSIQRKFVVGHELAHFVLHPKDNFFFVLAHTRFHNKFEHQADMFAITLLVEDLQLPVEAASKLATIKQDELLDKLRDSEYF